MGAQSYSGTSIMNGKDAVAMAVYQTPGSNAQEIIDELKAKFSELERDLPEGLKYNIVFDTNEFLEASINKVVSTLIEAFILVFLVVFILLQDIRINIIAILAIRVLFH